MSKGSSIILNRGGEKRRRVQDEEDVRKCIGEQNKLFYDLTSYFGSKFSEAQKENENWLRESKPIRTNLKKETNNSNWISMITSLHS